MTKEQMLVAIEDAEQIHLAQMYKIKSEIAGKKIENPTALSKKDCECGLWFHSNEEKMKTIFGLQLFDRLDKAHENWHYDYENIYKLFYVEEKKGIFSKILGSVQSNDMKIDKAKLYYSELKSDTDELLKVSEIAKRRVHALSDSKFT